MKISFDEYLARPGINSHALIDMQRSPLHCWSKHIDPARIPSHATPSMLLGSLVHSLVLEDDLSRYTILDNPRSKKSREESGSFNKPFVSTSQVLTAEAIRTSIVSAAGDFFRSGTPEVSLFHKDARYPLPLKCRIDWLDTDVGYEGYEGYGVVQPSSRIIELKTTTDASPRSFFWTAYRLGYFLSAAFYIDIVEEHLNVPVENFTFVVAETSPPYAVAIYELSPELIHWGRKLYEDALGKFEICWSAGHWPGYKAQILSWDMDYTDLNQDDDLVPRR